MMVESSGEPLSAGARDLARWLRRHEMSIGAFCRANGLDRITIQRVLNGARRRISVDLAFDIQRATGGDVGAERFRHRRAAR